MEAMFHSQLKISRKASDKFEVNEYSKRHGHNMEFVNVRGGGITSTLSDILTTLRCLGL